MDDDTPAARRPKTGLRALLSRLPPERRVLYALMGQVFLNMVGVSVVSPVMPLYAQSFGVSAAAVGGLITAFGVARIAANIPAGTLAERIGRRPLLILGPAVTAVAALLTGLAGEFNQLIAFRFLQGIGSAAQTTAAMVALADVTNSRDRGHAMALYQGSLLLGSSVGPSVGGLVGEQWGYRAPFFAYAAMSLVAGVWALFAVPETLNRVEAARRTAQHARDEAPATSTRRTLSALLLDVNFVLISLVTLAIFFTRTGSHSTVLPLLGYNRIGLSEGQLGLTMTLIALANFATISASGVLCDRYGRKAVIVPSAIVSGLALTLFAASHSYASFLVGGALLGIGTGMAGPAPAAYVADIAKPGAYGLTMGLYRTFGDVGVSIGPVLLGWISDRAGYNSALWVNAGMFLLAGTAFGLVARETSGRAMRCREAKSAG